MKYNVWLLVVGVMVVALATVTCGGGDAESEFSLLLPEGWVEDTEFGKAVMAESAGEEWAGFVKFAGGSPTVGGYEPNIFVFSIAVPRGTDLKELVDEEIRQITLGDPATKLVDRESISIDSIPAEQVIFRDPPDIGFPQGIELVQIYLLKDRREWLLQCTAGRQLAAEMELCKDTLYFITFQR